ncbi:MAG: mitochondrial fission ELM1 family protein [Xanthomonadales bacterium]|nr:mitochondrial fission ELM1 family protein [Xanthomonadales bacterium]
MRIWALADAAAGHLRQAEALAAALARAVGAETETLCLQGSLRARLLAPRFGDLSDLRAAGRALAPPWPELAVGCGRLAALATRRLRELGVRTVQILDPRLDPRRFDWVVAPRHDGLAGPNVLTTLGSLHPVDEAWLARARAEDPEPAALPRPRTALLLGGPSRHLPWGRRDLGRLIAILRHWLERDGGSLLVALSRRSPAWAERRLRRAFPGARFTPEGGRNRYAAFLAWADRLVVTADSVNMLSEACATGVPVRHFAPRPPSARLGRFLLALVEGDHARPLRLEAGAGGARPLRETAAVAAALGRALGLGGPAQGD